MSALSNFITCDAVMISIMFDLFETIENSSSVSSTKSNNNKNPLHQADISFFIGKCEAYMKQKGVIPIIQGRDCRQGREGVTLLHAAATLGNLEMIKYIVLKGADVNAVDNSLNMQTPMMVAIKAQKFDVATFLATSGALLSCQDCNGENIFHYFARANAAMHLKQVVAVSNLGSSDIQQLASIRAVRKKKPFPEDCAQPKSVVEQILRSYRESGTYSSVSDIKKLKASGGTRRLKKKTTSHIFDNTPLTVEEQDSLAAFSPKAEMKNSFKK